jgi:hypothetical protein
MRAGQPTCTPATPQPDAQGRTTTGTARRFSCSESTVSAADVALCLTLCDRPLPRARRALPPLSPVGDLCVAALSLRSSEPVDLLRRQLSCQASAVWCRLSAGSARLT